jgi:hypothetical protein
MRGGLHGKEQCRGTGRVLDLEWGTAKERGEWQGVGLERVLVERGTGREWGGGG